MKIRSIHKLRLIDMIRWPLYYDGLRSGLEKLPVPETIMIRSGFFPFSKKLLTMPQTLDQFSESITYGQRMYFSEPEPNDFGIVIRYVAGYFHPIATGEPWLEKNALEFGSVILHSRVIELFPAAMHLVKLAGQLVERELKLLKREPTNQEKAAGIDRLSPFADLNALMFLAESFKCTTDDVSGKPYNDCLVRFMLQKEQNAYAERLADVYRRESETKQKNKRK